ncbi:hypothetical protein VNI00_017857 [Paramarasmius palmivorus]|uniref:CCHC-type domain-containing protein n=1 Tax=Paramarasmius palmivorus TaxID=297713 RepID=A0AAW0B2Q6_9AGAR
MGSRQAFLPIGPSTETPQTVIKLPQEWQDITRFPWYSNTLTKTSLTEIQEDLPEEFKNALMKWLIHTSRWVSLSHTSNTINLVQKLKNDIRQHNVGQNLSTHGIMLYLLIDRLASTCNTTKPAPTLVSLCTRYEPHEQFHITALVNWPAILTACRTAQAQEKSQPPSNPTQINEDQGLTPITRRLTVIKRRQTRLSYAQVLQNLDHVALYLMVLKHAPNYPSPTDNADEILKGLSIEDCQVVKNHVCKNTPYWHNPLYFSLAITPLILLLGIKFHQPLRYHMTAPVDDSLLCDFLGVDQLPDPPAATPKEQELYDAILELPERTTTAEQQQRLAEAVTKAKEARIAALDVRKLKLEKRASDDQRFFDKNRPLRQALAADFLRRTTPSETLQTQLPTNNPVSKSIFILPPKLIPTIKYFHSTPYTIYTSATPPVKAQGRFRSIISNIQQEVTELFNKVADYDTLNSHHNANHPSTYALGVHRIPCHQYLSTVTSLKHHVFREKIFHILAYPIDGRPIAEVLLSLGHPTQQLNVRDYRQPNAHGEPTHHLIDLETLSAIATQNFRVDEPNPIAATIPTNTSNSIPLTGLSTDSHVQLQPSSIPSMISTPERSWSDFSTSHVYNRLQLPTSGLCRSVQCAYSSRIFFILVPTNATDTRTPSHRSYMTDLARDGTNTFGWVLSHVVLNPGDSFTRVALAEILLYWKNIICDTNHLDTTSKCVTSYHIPHPYTMTGILDILSLINITEMGSTLWLDTYCGVTHAPELISLYVRAKDAGEALVAWIANNCTITLQKPTDRSGNQEVMTPDRQVIIADINDIRQSYIIQQAMTLIRQASDEVPEHSITLSPHHWEVETMLRKNLHAPHLTVLHHLKEFAQSQSNNVFYTTYEVMQTAISICTSKVGALYGQLPRVSFNDVKAEEVDEDYGRHAPTPAPAILKRESIKTEPRDDEWGLKISSSVDKHSVDIAEIKEMTRTLSNAVQESIKRQDSTMGMASKTGTAMVGQPLRRECFMCKKPDHFINDCPAQVKFRELKWLKEGPEGGCLVMYDGSRLPSLAPGDT